MEYKRLQEKMTDIERQFQEKVEGSGWLAIHRGWPDFACIRNNKIMFVEVKGSRTQNLRRNQHFLLTRLAKLGFDCYKWSPIGGFEKILGDTPLRVKPESSKPEQEPILSPEELAEAQKLIDTPEHLKIFKQIKPEARQQALQWLREGRKVRW